jgi:hypothetical protein
MLLPALFDGVRALKVCGALSPTERRALSTFGTGRAVPRANTYLRA